MTEVRRYVVEREILIHARAETVWRWFADPERFARWFGAGSSLDATPGGAIDVRYPDGRRAEGEVVEVEPNARLVFTWGYPGDASPVPPGTSRVEVTLAETPAGTRVVLRHELGTEGAREAHVAGWRFYLSRLAAEAARDQFAAGLEERIDAWFGAWSSDDAKARAAALRAAAVDHVRFEDDFGRLESLDELLAHLGLVRTHMPGRTIARSGPPALSGRTVVCDWTVTDASGATVDAGRNVFELALDGRFERVVGLRPV